MALCLLSRGQRPSSQGLPALYSCFLLWSRAHTPPPSCPSARWAADGRGWLVTPFVARLCVCPVSPHKPSSCVSRLRVCVCVCWGGSWECALHRGGRSWFGSPCGSLRFCDLGLSTLLLSFGSFFRTMAPYKTAMPLWPDRKDSVRGCQSVEYGRWTGTSEGNYGAASSTEFQEFVTCVNRATGLVKAHLVTLNLSTAGSLWQ